MILAGHVWTDEVDRWADGQTDFVQAPYTRLSARRSTGKGHAPTGQLRPEYDHSWDALILDEAHIAKSRKAQWNAPLERLAERSGRVYLATGTPIVNWAHEMFSPLRLLYPDEAKPGGRFGSYWRWAETWFRVAPSRWHPQGREIGDLAACGPFCHDRPAWDPCDHYREFVAANLGSRFLMRLRDQVLADLPPLTQVRVDTPMTKHQASAYRSMRKTYLAELGDGDQLVAWSAGAKHVILDRMTTSLGVAASKRDLDGESGKLQRLEFDLRSRSRPTVVYAHYRETVDACVAVAQRLGLRVGAVDGRLSHLARGVAIRDFHRGRLDVLVGSLETLAEGVTLVQADMAILVEVSWKPSRNQQAIRRIHRLGQDRPCTVLEYVTPQTVDERKRELVATKADRALRFITATQMAKLV